MRQPPEQPHAPVLLGHCFLRQASHAPILSSAQPGGTMHSQAILSLQPQVEVQLQNAAQRLNDALFEAVVTVTVTAKSGDKTLFLVEAAQAGIF